MKKTFATTVLATTIGLTFNVSSSSIVAHNKISNNIITNKTNNQINDSKQTLFSNSYKALGNSTTWITNQSTSDKQYYSYDLSSFISNLSNGVDPKTLFTVDNNGKLQYKSGAQSQIPNQDKSTVDNVKAQIEKNKTVSKIKDSSNLYSKSIYNNQYFSSGNTDWQYIQFGGVAKHVNLSSQSNGNQVKNYQDLNESLGLYYIAQAVRDKKIDQKVANDLAIYFINQSDLATTLGNNPDLIKQIMNLLSYNDDVYNFVYQTPFYNSYKNYSLNFIFDKSNNLVEIYYNKWDVNNMTNSTSYVDNNGDPGYTYGYFYENGSVYNILDWTKYASSWSEFTTLYPSLTFDNDSYISIYNGSSGQTWTAKNATADTTSMNDKTPSFSDFNPDLTIYQDTSDYYRLGNELDGDNADINLALYMWHDTQYIYMQYCALVETNGYSAGSQYYVNITHITFNSVMS